MPCTAVAIDLEETSVFDVEASRQTVAIDVEETTAHAVEFICPVTVIDLVAEMDGIHKTCLLYTSDAADE